MDPVSTTPPREVKPQTNKQTAVLMGFAGSKGWCSLEEGPEYIYCAVDPTQLGFSKDGTNSQERRDFMFESKKGSCEGP